MAMLVQGVLGGAEEEIVMNKAEESRRRRAENLRYKRSALNSMGYAALTDELGEIQEACSEVHWYVDQDDDTLLNALDGDEEDAWEFKMAFADLEAKADVLGIDISDLSRQDDDFPQTYDDCTVALIGQRYTLIGYDSYEEDYYGLTGYERELAQTEAGKRLMRLTKAEMISTIGQCVGILVAFLDLRQQYDYLKAAFDVLRDENTSMLQQIREIEDAYQEAAREGWYYGSEAVKRFDQLLAALPDRAWIE